MDKKIKAKWLKALRSGKYKQGHSKLHAGDRYCCLGVLCDVMEAKHHPGASELPSAVIRRTKLSKFGRLPEGVPEDFYGKSGELGGEISLAGFNDSGLSFKRIAQLIERYL